MKLITFTAPGAEGERLGVFIGDDENIVLDVGAASERSRERGLHSMQDLIERGVEGLDAVAELAAHASDHPCFSVDSIQLLAPLPQPVQMRYSLSFKQHLVQALDRRNSLDGVAERTPAQEMRLALYDRRPHWYKCNRMAVCGPDTIVVWPPYSRQMDYELELGVIVGRKGTNIAQAKAHDYIFGYTIFNDFSARDVQDEEMGMLGPNKSKDFDNANAIGPCIVTADAFDPADARMTARINGEVQSVNSTSSITWPVDRLISAVSLHETIYPGEILCTGTVGGGCGYETGRLLDSGDVIELEVEGIGILRNRVVASGLYQAL